MNRSYNDDDDKIYRQDNRYWDVPTKNNVPLHCVVEKMRSFFAGILIKNCAKQQPKKKQQKKCQINPKELQTVDNIL